MLKRPLFPVGIAFALGIVLSGVLKLPAPVVLSVLGFGCLCALSRRAVTLALLLAIMAAGMLRYGLHTRLAPNDVSRFIDAHPAAVVGRVASDVDLRRDRAFVPLKVRAVEVAGRMVPADGRLMVVCYRPEAVPEWRPPAYGDVLFVRARVSRPGGASNPGAFSWRDYLARQRIHAVAYVGRPAQVTLLPEHEASPFVSLALWAKDRLSDTIASRMPPDEAATVIGMVLGTYAALPDRLLANFQKTGTLHLLAASGFNCAVLMIVFGFLLTRILRLPKRVINPLLIVILIFYMLMVGAKPSIVRATVMASLWLLGGILNRPADTLNVLFAAAIIILAINPADLFDVGFQLSFAAVLALILVLPVIIETARRWRLDPSAGKVPPRWRHRAAVYLAREGWQGLTATAAATLGTLPLSAHYFNYLSLVCIAVNAIVAATVLPIFVIGLLMPFVSPVPLLGDAVSAAGTAITRFALSAINWFGELPRSCVSVGSPGTFGVVGYYVLLAAGLRYAYWRIGTKAGTRDR